MSSNGDTNDPVEPVEPVELDVQEEEEVSQEPQFDPTQRYLIGVKYEKNDPWADFELLLKKANRSIEFGDPNTLLLLNSLFIYNENAFQYTRPENRNPGGGNAVIRPWRADAPMNASRFAGAKSLGIPTDGYPRLVRNSMTRIVEYLKQHPEINKIFWSTEKGKLGLGIFAGMPEAQANQEFVSQALPSLLNTHLNIIPIFYRNEKSDQVNYPEHPLAGQTFQDMEKFLLGLLEKDASDIASEAEAEKT